jgi:hypothetical protein
MVTVEDAREFRILYNGTGLRWVGNKVFGHQIDVITASDILGEAIHDALLALPVKIKVPACDTAPGFIPGIYAVPVIEDHLMTSENWGSLRTEIKRRVPTNGAGKTLWTGAFADAVCNRIIRPEGNTTELKVAVDCGAVIFKRDTLNRIRVSTFVHPDYR